MNVCWWIHESIRHWLCNKLGYPWWYCDVLYRSQWKVQWQEAFNDNPFYQALGFKGCPGDQKFPATVPNQQHRQIHVEEREWSQWCNRLDESSHFDQFSCTSTLHSVIPLPNQLTDCSWVLPEPEADWTWHATKPWRMSIPYMPVVSAQLHSAVHFQLICSWD